MSRNKASRHLRSYASRVTASTKDLPEVANGTPAALLLQQLGNLGPRPMPENVLDVYHAATRTLLHLSQEEFAELCKKAKDKDEYQVVGRVASNSEELDQWDAQYAKLTNPANLLIAFLPKFVATLSEDWGVAFTQMDLLLLLAYTYQGREHSTYVQVGQAGDDVRSWFSKFGDESRLSRLYFFCEAWIATRGPGNKTSAALDNYETDSWYAEVLEAAGYKKTDDAQGQNDETL